MAFDIGANVGDTSLMMASCVGRSGSVCAFEPNPACFTRLTVSSQGAWNRNVRPFELALADRAAKAELFIDLRAGAYASTLVKTHAQRETAWHAARYAPATVEATTLDGFCEVFEILPSFIKIDVEGAEGMVIRGGLNVITNSRPVIWFECWCGQLGGERVNEDMAHFNELEKVEYTFLVGTIFKLNGEWIPESSAANPSELLPCDKEGLEQVPAMGCDIVAVPTEKLSELNRQNLVSSLTLLEHIAKLKLQS